MAGKKIMITLSQKKAEELDKLAKEKGVSKSMFIALVIEEFAKKGDLREKK